ncbi:hypothetical protein [Sorangium sp. So ce1335]|uniref:hypothetical protein n=1 Tax=Sorangium sp. So ce1335 TaxID=3133335 RepID=UPI003F6445AA
MTQDQTFSRLAFCATLASWVAISCAPAESDSNNDGGGGATATGSVDSASGSGVATSGGSASGSGVATSGGTTVAGTGGDNSGGSGGAEPTGSGGAGMGGWPEGAIPMGNAPVPSAGCGKATTLTTREYTISSSGQNRVYYVDMPSNYDMNKPCRLFYTSHRIGSRWQDVEGQDFYFLEPQTCCGSTRSFGIGGRSARRACTCLSIGGCILRKQG